MTAEWTPQAEQDLAEIAEYIAEQAHRPLVAEQLIRDLHERAEFYARSPNAGARHPVIPPPMRVFVHKRWVVVYEPREEGGIVVHRVIDGSRDFTRLF